jgi:hypothetical protein
MFGFHKISLTHYESDIDEKSFHSMFIYPGIYLMTVSVHKKAPRIEVARGTVDFNLTGKVYLSKTNHGPD